MDYVRCSPRVVRIAYLTERNACRSRGEIQIVDVAAIELLTVYVLYLYRNVIVAFPHTRNRRAASCQSKLKFGQRAVYAKLRRSDRIEFNLYERTLLLPVGMNIHYVGILAHLCHHLFGSRAKTVDVLAVETIFENRNILKIKLLELDEGVRVVLAQHRLVLVEQCFGGFYRLCVHDELGVVRSCNLRSVGSVESWR